MAKNTKRTATENRGENESNAAQLSEVVDVSGGRAQHAVRNVVLAGGTIIGVFLCYDMALPFVPALGWALALTVMFCPLQRWLELKLKHPGLAAGVSVMVVGLVLMVSATFVAQRLVGQAGEGAKRIDSFFESGEWRRVLHTQPRIDALFVRVEKYVDVPGAAKFLASWLSNLAGSIIKGSVFQVVGFSLVLYLLFFFLRDRDTALRSMRSISPLSEVEMDLLIGRVADAIHATIYGTLAVSLVQGLLGGLMFWWLGLPSPMLWGLVMALLAVVPVLGAFIVWIPAAVFLALEGSWGKALILTIWGLFVVGTIDNLLYPILVGQRLKLHTVLAFVSVVGGLMVFGPVGLILGPVVLTVTISFFEIWSNRAAVKQVNSGK